MDPLPHRTAPAPPRGERARRPSGGRGRRAVRWAAAAALAAAGLAVVLLKSPPAVYERTAPMGPDPEAVRAFNRRVVNHVVNVLLDESGGTRLAVEVTEAMVNARLARFLAEERRAGRPVPAVLEGLRVGFEPGAVVLATRLGRGWSAVVVAQWLRLETDGEGRLRVRPAGARLGSLPMPVDAAEVIRTALDRLGGGDARAGTEPEPRGPEAVLRAVARALAGEPVPLGRGKRRIVLERVEVDRGVLRAWGRRAGAGREKAEP